jgi:hypothetical protein
MFFGKGKEFKERVISTGFRWIETLSLNPGSQARQDFAGFKTKVLNAQLYLASAQKFASIIFVRSIEFHYI